MATTNYFEPFDYVVLLVTLLMSLCVGMYYSFSKNKTTEYLLAGGRNNSVLPAAASVMATTVSAITILGFPAEIYSYGVQIFHIVIMAIVFVPLSALIFVPFLYPMKLVSVYEYLEFRFDSVAVRWFASFAFILQQLLLSGLVLYAPSIALEAFLGFPPWISIIGIGVCGTIYTSFGGLKAVLATDTFQVIIMFFGMGAILVKAFMVAGGFSTAMSIAERDGRFNLFDFTFDPFMRHNFFNFLLGLGFADLVQPGTRQHEVQRYSSMPSLSAAKKSLLYSIPIKSVSLGISCLTGVALYAAYEGCDPIRNGEIKKSDELIPLFVMRELKAIPGMIGLFTACIFCGVLSSYSSSLNGLVAVTWTDFLSKLPVCRKMSDTKKGRFSMGLGVAYGVLIVSLAFSGDNFGDIYQASYAVTGPSTGVMCAVFLMALFMPFVTKQGAFCGMCLGLGSTIFIAAQSLRFNPKTPTLPTSIESCTGSAGNISYAFSGTPATLSPLEWPEKIYSLSYVVYPIFAAVVTLLSGILISLLLKPFTSKNEVNEEYVHPLVRKTKKPKMSQEEYQLKY